MRETKKKEHNSFVSHRTIILFVVLLLNAILLTFTFVLFINSSNDYQERLKEENVNNIANINYSEAQNISALVENWTSKLNDIVKYIDFKDLNYNDALDYIYESSSNELYHFQVIGPDYTGYQVKSTEEEGHKVVSYTNASYDDLQVAVDDVEDDDFDGEICFTSEFTDKVTTYKYFAIYKHITINESCYTILLCVRSSIVLNSLNSFNDYDGKSTILINTNGDYIVKSNFYQYDDFYDFIYNTNDLSLDEKNEIRSNVNNTISGQLYYMIDDVEYIFQYEKILLCDWYSISCVPINSFHTSSNSNSLGINIAIVLLILLLIDALWFIFINRRLRLSIQREIAASSAKGNFMSRMSHEIRTPLNAIIGYNTLAMSDIKEAKNKDDHRTMEMRILDCLTKSDIASKHLLTIINDVLDMSAIESGKIKVVNDRFDFKGLINSLTSVFYSQAKHKGVDLEVIFDNLTEEWFIGDQVRVNQVLTNLLANAIKFTPENGQVILKIKAAGNDTSTTINFEISDTGIGMTPEFLDRMWIPFEQADTSIYKRFGGTGLGLSITKTLVELMKGKIEVESTIGVGSKFIVTLDFERTTQPTNEEIYNFKNMKALIVDDDTSTCDYIKLLFSRCGVKAIAVSSGFEAIDAINYAIKINEPFTLYLIDWKMPKMNGLETAKRIKDITADVPIIIITAYDFTEIREQANAIGINTFISKPLFQSSLFDLLANISGKSTIKKVTTTKYDFNGSKLLLAEDNIMNMEIAKRILESAGFIIDSVWNGEEAVEKVLNSSPGTYQAVLMDIQMPKMDGYEATRTIRRSEHPDAASIPIIAMTADAFTENIAEAHAAGMNDHIAKPISIKILFETLSKYIK